MLDISRLVDAETGLVSKAAYTDEDVYRRELEQVFGRCWLYLAHESQLPRPGDFVSAYMGEDPVIVIRDSAGHVGAFLNVCRHRGTRVCRADAGNAASFTCPYHGWTYGNDGSLVSVPGFRDWYGEALDLSAWGLAPVAQVESYKGFVFGTFDPEAPPLVEYLGDMAWWLDAVAERREGGIEVIPGVLKWRMRTNWKFAAEQFAGDSYHSQPSHASAVIAGFAGPALQQAGGFRNRAQGQGASFLTANLGNGHGTLVSRTTGDDRPGLATAAMTAYDEEIATDVDRRLARDGWAAGMSPGLGTMFPNFSRLATNFSLRVWHPRGPNETEVWSWTYVDRLAPPEVKEEHRLFSLRAFGPAGAFEQDDGENWILATGANRGPAARRVPMNFGMGMARVEHAEDPDAWYAQGTSESNGRAFFQRWQAFMDGRSWPELAASDQTPVELRPRPLRSG